MSDADVVHDWHQAIVDALVPVVAERDKARRVAVSLEADLARILNAWDNGADYPQDVWLARVERAIGAAREWVGTDTGPTT